MLTSVRERQFTVSVPNPQVSELYTAQADQRRIGDVALSQTKVFAYPKFT